MPRRSGSTRFSTCIQIFHLKIVDTVLATERLRARALRENRLDDMSDEVIHRRLQTYYDETFKTLSFFPERPDLRRRRRPARHRRALRHRQPTRRHQAALNQAETTRSDHKLFETDGASRICRPPHTRSPSRPGMRANRARRHFNPTSRTRPELPELTFSAVALGSILGIVFGASSLYLFLKVGMTVSASIPVAVLAITIFRGLSTAFGIRRTTILENNIVQTAGSAGESIAFGVGATMPALMLLGYELEWTRVMLVAVLGGLLGILMMIPLRRAFIVKQHGALPYPEGTACAKVLIVGEQGGSNARTVFTGFGLGFLYQILMQAFKFWSGEWQQADHGHHGLQQGDRVAGAVADLAGSRLHHRAADRVGHGRRRHPDGALPRADDRLLRRRASGRSSAGPAADLAVRRPARSPVSMSATSVPERWRPAAS